MSQSAPSPMQLTSDAANKIKELMAEEDNPALKLRVYITGGGCSGFQYGFAFEESANDDDMTIEHDGVQVVVDPMSLQYLLGAEISYEEGIQGAQFTINNPNAQTTCGCGASFSVAE